MGTVAEKIVDILEEREGKDKKIMFLPYKLEMWDSMASVFVECKNRGFEVALHPIPYMYLQNNRTTEQYIDTWNGPEMESFAEIEDFNPDIVVIHYPFDYRNTVTTIPKKYYSSEFKKQGKKIVYIPYHGNACPDSFYSEVLLPGIVNADYIFIHDDRERNLYLNTWMKYNIKSHGEVFATGSPKVDIYKLAKDKICSKDSILIVNSFVSYLSDVKRLNKYRAIIDTELEKGEKIIFRPHPLLEQTLAKQHYFKYIKYREFEEDIFLKGVKIDKASCLYSTLRISKKIYSDSPSITELCREAGFEVEEIK